nr:ribosome biogenesis protein SPATA5 [Andalucia godoyi]|eukprot:ANDGO_03981.mRNA.1 ATPase family gene 2 protein
MPPKREHGSTSEDAPLALLPSLLHFSFGQALANDAPPGSPLRLAERKIRMHPDAVRASGLIGSKFVQVSSLSTNSSCSSSAVLSLSMDDRLERSAIAVPAAFRFCLKDSLPPVISSVRIVSSKEIVISCSSAIPDRTRCFVEAAARADLALFVAFRGMSFSVDWCGTAYVFCIESISSFQSEESAAASETGCYYSSRQSSVVFRYSSSVVVTGEFDVIGMDYVAVQLRDLFESLHCCRVLLHGPTGTGKTSLVKMVAERKRMPVIEVDGAVSSTSKYFGDAEHGIRKKVHEAKVLAPCVLLLKNIDLLCPRRDSAVSESQKRLATTVLQLVSDLDLLKSVFVIATSHRSDDIDPAMRRPGRLDVELAVHSPSDQERYLICQFLASKSGHFDLSDEEWTQVGRHTRGFVGRDIEFMIKECLVLVPPPRHVCFEDVLRVCKSMTPATLRSIAVEVPKVFWTDVGGQDSVKQQLKEAVEWPMKHAKMFLQYGIRPLKGVLMYGPPGCSKTMLAKAIATECALSFLAVKGPELLGKYVGDSEQAVRRVFERARAATPCVIFFDEIDALAAARKDFSSGSGERVLAQLLAEMDGMAPLSQVVVLAATNRPDRLDSALLRPGRFDRVVYVPLPDLGSRTEIWRINLQKLPTDIPPEEIGHWARALSERSEGLSGAEIVAVCKEASMAALEIDMDASVISKGLINDALEKFCPRITAEQLVFFEQFRSSFRKS